jgi:AraC-like DNA-binding protein
MSDPSVRMSAIALDSGFSSASHFTNAFHKTFGVTPTQWRASLAVRRTA